jgi:arylsulfatase A-like enzyme
MTGLRPSTTGVYALEPWFRTSEPLNNWVTLPQYFAKHGYQTLTTGKIYHDAYPPKADRNNGTEFGTWGFHGGAGPYPPKKIAHPPCTHPIMDWGPFPERDEQLDDAKVADWAIDHLKSMPKDKPFFLGVGFRRPHVPCFAPQKWFDLYPLDTLILPPCKVGDRADTPMFSWCLHWSLPEPRLEWLQANNEWKPLVRAYLASTSFMDGQVGRVLEALQATGQADNTVIVFWGDNGWHLGEKDITGKNTLWDRSTRVPLIVAGPGVTSKGHCEQPAELLDIYPTLVALCGLPAKPDIEGHSLVPQLKDAATPRPWPAITTHGPGNHGIRTDRWRYIR